MTELLIAGAIVLPIGVVLIIFIRKHLRKGLCKDKLNYNALLDIYDSCVDYKNVKGRADWEQEYYLKCSSKWCSRKSRDEHAFNRYVEHFKMMGVQR